MSNWNGNGLPPVGEVCNIRARCGGSHYSLMNAEIKYISEQACVALSGGGEYAFETELAKFEPIKSEAELKREKAVEEIADALLDAGAQDVPESIAEGMYDVGYRKVNGLTDDQIRERYPLHASDEPLRRAAKWARAQIMGEES